MTTCAGKESRPRAAQTLSGTKVRPRPLDCRTAQPILSAWPRHSTGPISTKRATSSTASCGRGGVFAALWNPRFIEANPLLVEIEAQITRLKPDIRRVSSGRSGITERLTDLLSAKPQFAEVLYLEGRHSLHQTPEQYIGAWRSVNDLQVQLGPELFRQFLDFTEKRIAGLTAIETTYLTRAWAARRA